MPDVTLIMLAGEVRSKTLRILDGVTEAQARFTPRGLNNTILWHAGHAYVLVEHLGIAPATGRLPEYPAGWFETFSWKSNPALVTEWPSLNEVISRLGDQLRRLTNAIEALTPQQLDQLLPNNRPLRYSILHGLHDEASHQGEMYLLKKMVVKGGDR